VCGSWITAEREIGETPGGRKIKRRKLNEEVESSLLLQFRLGQEEQPKQNGSRRGLFCYLVCVCVCKKKKNDDDGEFLEKKKREIYVWGD
jgi:hypothetical protein